MRPSAHAKTMSGFVGWMINAPDAAGFVEAHVLPGRPASVDLYIPLPITSTSRMAHASPVPAHTMLGFDGATASDPMAATGCVIENRSPSESAVYRFENSARSGARVISVDVARNAGDGRDAVPASGPTKRNRKASTLRIRWPRRCA